MNEIVMYSAVATMLMIACTAGASLLFLPKMSGLAATTTTTIRNRQLRRRRSQPQPEHHPGGPYRTPGVPFEDPLVTRLSAVAARFSPIPTDRNWFTGMSAEKLMADALGFLVRIIIAAALLALVIPLLSGAVFTGGPLAAVGLAAGYFACSFVVQLLHAAVLMVVLKTQCIQSRLGICVFMALWLLVLFAVPGAALKLVDAATTSFNLSGWIATIGGGMVMWLAHIRVGAKSADHR